MIESNQKVFDIAIVGAGAAGMMATLRSVLNNDQTLTFEGSAQDKKKSRAQWVRKIENMPGFFSYKRGIMEPNKETLKFIQDSPFADKLTFKRNTSVKSLKKNEDGLFEIQASDDKVYIAKFVILTTGVMDIQPHIEESIETIFPYANVQVVDYCIRCDGHHTLGKELSIIGKDSSAIWIAAMLHERYNPPNITIITDGLSLELSEELKELVEVYNIDIVTNPLDGVVGDPKKGVLEGFKLCNGQIVQTDFCFVSLGMIVYNELARGLNAKLDQRGFVLTDPKGESSVSNLFVAGDLRANAKKQVYTAWDHAVDSADEINARLRKEKRSKAIEAYKKKYR